MEALIIPWALLLLVLVVVACLAKRWFKAGTVIFIVLLLANWYWNVFSFGFDSLDEHMDADSLKVMTWNISCADASGTNDMEGLVERILSQDADVVFVTEYSREAKPEIDSLLSKVYQYKGGLQDWQMLGEVYSSVPIDSCRCVEGEGNGHLFRFEIQYRNLCLPIFCLHLQSNNILNGEQFYPDSIQGRGGVSHYLENYRLASEIRAGQAVLVVSDMTDSPCIVIGDMNDVAGSPALDVFEKAGLKDAWWKGGFGYGATIHKPLPYRIDHIMYSDGLRLKGIKKVDANGLPDHDALVAEFEFE